MSDENTTAEVVEETEAGAGEASVLESGYASLVKGLVYAVIAFACLGATLFVGTSNRLPGLPYTTPWWIVLGMFLIAGMGLSLIGAVGKLNEFADCRTAIGAEWRRIQANWVPQVGEVVSYRPWTMAIYPFAPVYVNIVGISDEGLDLGDAYGVVPKGAVRLVRRYAL